MDETTHKIVRLPQVKRVLELIGLTAIVWTKVETIWYLIYTCLLHEAPRKKVDRIYQHFITGAAKRDFALNLAAVAFAGRDDTDKLCVLIAHLNERTNQLSRKRNNIVHAEYGFRPFGDARGLHASPANDQNKRSNELAKVGNKLAEEIEKTIDQISAHYDELDRFRAYIMQNVLPEDKRIPFLPPGALKSMPGDLLKMMPLERRERVPLQTPRPKSGKGRRPKS